ncbi:MAG: hypothetical protein J0H78_07825 [Rhizobiales bacterium]|nr:hypothetical protein [Hyphomicrobiales bacterium]OJY41846.1 MAG: hypothetical protein BGP08_10865 [Rhizobiales bacterium 64-17]
MTKATRNLDERALNRLTLYGFLGVYFGAFGALLVATMPLFGGWNTTIIKFVALPVVILGLAMIAIERVIRWRW